MPDEHVGLHSRGNGISGSLESGVRKSGFNTSQAAIWRMALQAILETLAVF